MNILCAYCHQEMETVTLNQAQPTILGYPQPSCDPFTEMTRSLTVTEWLGFDWAAVR